MITDEKLVKYNFNINFEDSIDVLYEACKIITKLEKECGDTDIGDIINWSISMYDRLNITDLKAVVMCVNNDNTVIALEYDIYSPTTPKGLSSWNGSYMIIENISDTEDENDIKNSIIKMRKIVYTTDSKCDIINITNSYLEDDEDLENIAEEDKN